MHLDRDPQESAFYKAIKVVAEGVHNGSAAEVRTAYRQLNTAIDAFPPARHAELKELAARRTREWVKTLQADQLQTQEAREAAALRDAIDWHYAPEQSNGIRR